MDIASLGIKIDTSDAATAVTDLDKVTQSGAKAEKAAEGVAAGFEKASSAANDLATTEKKLAESTDDAKTRLLAMAKASLESSEYCQRLTSSVTDSAGAMDTARASTTNFAAIQKSLNTLRPGLDQQADATKRAAAATGVQAEGLQALLAKINPVIGALGKLDERQAQLNKYKNAGIIDTETFKEYSALIEVSRQKTAGFSEEAVKAKGGISSLALNSKEARENVLQLANALSEGNIRIAAHNILEIATNAGSSALALAATVGPALLAGAAIAAMVVAYSQGSAEAKAYNQSLILTGNYAGVSSSQLGEMARQVSATVGTTGAAAEVLATLAGNGKIASGAFVEITQAAISMKEATGKAVGETIAEFVKIADDPVKASAALNEQYHYLTASVYAQIVALEKQGDHAGAVKLATDQFADTINGRTPKILENLSLWERAYNQLAKAADGIKNVGRIDINSDIAQAQQSLAALQATGGRVSLPGKNISFYGDQGVKDLQAYIKALQGKDEQEKISAKQDSDNLAKQEVGSKAYDWIQRELDSTASKAEKLKKALEAVDIKVAASRASGLTVSDSEVERLRKQETDKFTDKPKAGTINLTAFNDAQNSLKTLQDAYSNTEKQLDASQKAGLIS
ncbi:phage tail length tape measure family protein, partial [Pseudomonas sp.]|uniref:phage tail length tape measure family protein n=1 Tax=Pseudomonas sp. TaxID=306 RepID=UPI003FD882E5